VVIRYADDLVALCHTQRQTEQVKATLAEWLAPRGLAFNEEKTRIVHLSLGFDFLGFNVRRYNGKLLIKPSKAAIQRIRERLRTEMLALRGSNAKCSAASRVRTAWRCSDVPGDDDHRGCLRVALCSCATTS
jgi:RNA-directed DNA polymerase